MKTGHHEDPSAALRKSKASAEGSLRRHGDDKGRRGEMKWVGKKKRKKNSIACVHQIIECFYSYTGAVVVFFSSLE